MEFLLNRYRNLTVLLIVIVAQLVLIAYQVKTNKDVPLIRVWAVTAVTPVEQGLEFVRRNTIGRVEDYFYLLGVKSDNERLRKEVGQLKIENNFLRSELSTADRLQALGAFEARSPSKMLAARIIGNGTGANSKVVFVDRGSGVGVESGMAVVTPDGIAGKVVDAYPTASLVMLVSDPTFAAGVLSQKNRLHGTLKGQGHGACIVDYIQNEQKVDVGEWFYTSGDDRIFPKGFPAGQVTAVRNGKAFKEISLTPSGLQNGVEEVLILLQGVHLQLPENQIASPAYKLLPPPPASSSDQPANVESGAALSTDGDRLKEQYREAAKAQNHPFGEGYKPPDFTKLGAPWAPATPKTPANRPAGAPSPAAQGTAAPRKTGAPGVAASNGTQPATPIHRTRPAGTAADLTAPGAVAHRPQAPGQAVRTPLNGAAPGLAGPVTGTAVHRTGPAGTAADLPAPGTVAHRPQAIRTPTSGAAPGLAGPVTGTAVHRTRPAGTAADLTAPGAVAHRPQAIRTPTSGAAPGSAAGAPVRRTASPGATGSTGAPTGIPARKTTTTGQQPSEAGARHPVKRLPATGDPGAPPAAKPKPKAASPPPAPNPTP